MGTGRLRGWVISSLPLVVVAALGWYEQAGTGWRGVGEAARCPYERHCSALPGLLAALWIILLVAFLLRPPGHGCRHRWLLVPALVALPWLGLCALGARVFGGAEEAQLRLPDGSVYRVRGYVHSPDYLSAEVRRGLLFSRERLLAEGDTEFPLLLVRPAGAQPRAHDGQETLVASSDGRWLALVNAYGRGRPGELAGCQSHLVYDLRAGKGYEAQELEEVSPFVLVGPHDHLDREDVQALLAKPGRVRPQGLNFVEPAAATIARDLGHPNPEVRAVAARMVERARVDIADTATMDALQGLAATSPDPVVRKAAGQTVRRVKEAAEEGH